MEIGASVCADITACMGAGVGLKHLSGDIKRMLGRIMAIDQNNYPEMLGHTCIINAPGVFKLVWSAIKGFIDPKTQEKIEVSTHEASESQCNMQVNVRRSLSCTLYGSNHSLYMAATIQGNGLSSS